MHGTLNLTFFHFHTFFFLFCFGRPRLRRLRIIWKWRLIVDVEVGAGDALGVLLLMQVNILRFHMRILSNDYVEKKWFSRWMQCKSLWSNSVGLAWRYKHNVHISSRCRPSCECSFAFAIASHLSRHITQCISIICLMSILAHVSTAWISFVCFCTQYIYILYRLPFFWYYITWKVLPSNIFLWSKYIMKRQAISWSANDRFFWFKVFVRNKLK